MSDLATEAKVITIDGSSASGKGTLAKNIAEKLDWGILDSGAIYRVIGLVAERYDLLKDERALIKKLEDIDIQFLSHGCFVDDEDVSEQIRTEKVGKLASNIATFSNLRAEVLDLQRGFRKAPGLVADGRDMGTVVFPDAEVKFFLEASAEARAQRRYNELKNKGFDVRLPLLLEEILDRDARDLERSVAPLRPADDSILIDSSQLSAFEVTEVALSTLEKLGIYRE